MRWSFQTTHHDIWDYDVPSQPVLVDFVPSGHTEKVRALVAPTKRGELFLLDRATGQPLLPTLRNGPFRKPMCPRNGPANTAVRCRHARLQSRAAHRGAVWGITPIDQMLCRIQFRRLRYEGPLTPPSVNGSLQFPGFAGGMNWGSVAVDETSSVMIVNALQFANHVQIVSTR